MLVNKQRLCLEKSSTGRKSQGGQTTTMKQKGGFGHDNYRKNAPFFGRKSTIFAQTFGFGLYFG
jgi:hypothetical protein